MAIWAALFLAYFIIFAVRLQKWDDNISAHCYRTAGISRPQDPHPYVDNIYLGLTFFYICGSFLFALELSIFPKMPELHSKLSDLLAFQLPTNSLVSQRFTAPLRTVAYYQEIMNMVLPSITTDRQVTILAIAMIQCPIHIYSICALRFSNKSYLEGGPETAWGFGQIVAMVLLGGNILQFIDGYIGECHVEHTRTSSQSNEYRLSQGNFVRYKSADSAT